MDPQLQQILQHLFQSMQPAGPSHMPNEFMVHGGNAPPIPNRATSTAPPQAPTTAGLAGASAAPPQPPMPNMYEQAMGQAKGMQQQQMGQMGMSGEHPIHSLLNLIAAIGQGFNSGMHGEQSPFAHRAEMVQSPEYELGLAGQIMQEQMQPLEQQNIMSQIQERGNLGKARQQEAATQAQRTRMYGQHNRAMERQGSARNRIAAERATNAGQKNQQGLSIDKLIADYSRVISSGLSPKDMAMKTAALRQAIQQILQQQAAGQPTDQSGQMPMGDAGGAGEVDFSQLPP